MASIAPSPTEQAASDELQVLVERCLAGDRAAAAELYTRYYPLVLAIQLAATGGDRHLAADLTQDTFTKVLFRLDQFAWRGPASLRGWIATIARNTFRDHVRAAAQRHHGGYDLPEVVDVSDEHRPDAVADRDLAATEALATRVLDRLKPEHQHVLRRMLGDGVPAAQLAAELGRSEAAVHQLKKRALDAARRSAAHVHAGARGP